MAESGGERVACHGGYHLPEHVAPHVKVVTPTVHFGNVRMSSPFGKRDGVLRARDANRPGPSRTNIVVEVCYAIWLGWTQF